MAWSIGEMTEMTGLSADTLRYYERIELLPAPARSSGGRRIYRERDLGRVRFIQHAQAIGFSLDEVGQLLRFREDPTAAAGPCGNWRHASTRRYVSRWSCSNVWKPSWICSLRSAVATAITVPFLSTWKKAIQQTKPAPLGGQHQGETEHSPVHQDRQTSKASIRDARSPLTGCVKTRSVGSERCLSAVGIREPVERVLVLCA